MCALPQSGSRIRAFSAISDAPLRSLGEVQGVGPVHRPRLSANGRGQYYFAVYSAGIQGRTLQLAVTFRSQGQAIPDRPDIVSEPAEERLESPVRSLPGGHRVVGPPEVTGEFVERDAAGAVVATEERTITLQ